LIFDLDILSTYRKNKAKKMTSKEAMLETDTEFHVRLITFEISAR
jgi:hypothetical protein